MSCVQPRKAKIFVLIGITALLCVSLWVTRGRALAGPVNWRLFPYCTHHRQFTAQSAMNNSRDPPDGTPFSPDFGDRVEAGFS